MPKEAAFTISVNTAKGTFSGMVATLVTHPLDLIKVRRQINVTRMSSFRIAYRVWTQHGWKAFYTGLSAGLLRQATNTASRLTVYDILHTIYERKNAMEPSHSARIIIGVLSSMAGGVIGNPSEMVLVRRMAGGCRFLTEHGRFRCDRPATTTYQTFVNIIREEGFQTLWRGTQLTLIRSVTLSAIQIGSYEYLKIKEFLKKNNLAHEKHDLRLYTLIITHFFSALLTFPVDRLKSFYQLSRDKNDTEWGMMKHLYKRGGVRGMFRGFIPYFVRMTIHAYIQFSLMEQICPHSKVCKY